MLNPSDKEKLRALLRNEDAYATSLLAVALDAYGTELFSWDPETLWINLAEDYGTEVNDVNKDKLQALLLAYTTNLPFVSVEAFNHVCNVLSGSEANFQSWDPLTPEEAIWGIYETMLHVGIDREEGESGPEFSHEVRRYLGVILKNDGIFDPPDILRIAEFDKANDIEEWSDDPDIYNGAFDHQKTEKARLIEWLGTRLLGLLEELNGLPLQFRNPEWDKFRQAVETSARRMIGERNSALASRG